MELHSGITDRTMLTTWQENWKSHMEEKTDIQTKVTGW